MVFDGDCPRVPSIASVFVFFGVVFLLNCMFLIPICEQANTKLVSKFIYVHIEFMEHMTKLAHHNLVHSPSATLIIFVVCDI